MSSAPRSRTGASRASATRPARRARIRHPASGKSKALAAPATLAQALPADARDVAPRTASWAATRRVAAVTLALPGMRLATDLGFGLSPLT
ncbi:MULTISPECIES: hypothetical protein [Burkholderia]|uniref:hypothetical protein n=1 Tax=Burkholderia TaxID=32008 RepID=UPI00064E7886|nr:MULTISPECIES: hypothetical protein [Burkholderia]KML21995.1 hypothetical protein VL00_00145 [Burkholderia cepacia]KMN58960.1 hypothetical protein VK92_18465 [Burkholderia sp. LK4]